MEEDKIAKQAQEKHDKHMRIVKHLNTLRGEIIKIIDSDPHIAFKEMDDKSKSNELLEYFKSVTWAFNENSTADDVIIYLKKYIKEIDFLK